MGFFETFVQCNRITKHFTRQLSGTVCLIALSTLNYGFDNQGIATSQAMDAYQKQFGDYDPDTDTYAIPGYFLSLLNGLPFIGFALGTCHSLCPLPDDDVRITHFLSLLTPTPSRSRNWFDDQRTLWPPHDHVPYVVLGNLHCNHPH